MTLEKKRWFLRGMRDGVPIMLGYLAVGFTLGIAARNAGIDSIFFSRKGAVSDLPTYTVTSLTQAQSLLLEDAHA